MKKYTIGIDIGGTNTTIGLVSNSGEVLKKTNIPTTTFQDINDFINDIAVTIKNIIQNIPHDEIYGIGVGAPNGNFYKGTIENAPNLIWKGIIHFSDLLSKAVGLEVRLTNDANAAALGEMTFGSAKGIRDFILITLGTGLGSGIVVDGKLVYGSDGFAGELGHYIIVPDKGRLCGCGRVGCLETYCSATGIVNTAKELLSINKFNSILTSISIEQITAKDIFDAAQKGDDTAIEIFEITGKYLGFALANAATVTSPQAIFMFGGLASAGEYIFNPAQKWLDYYLLSNYKGKIKLLPSGLSENNAAILGASSLFFS